MSAIRSVLIHTCDIYRRSAGTADFGNPSGTYAVHLTGVVCRKHERTAPDHDMPSDVIEQSVVFWFLTGTDINMHDQIFFGGERYDIRNPIADVAGMSEFMRVTATRSEVA
jgi:hypothetical protein